MDFEAKAEELLQRLEAMSRNTPQKMVNELSKGEIFLLNYLLSCDGVARSSAMSDAMQTSTARIAAAVNSMERKGWVYRQSDRADQRKTLVHLTPAGQQHILACRELARSALKELLTELGEGDTTEYLRITGRMAQIASRLQERY
ncbi:MAG: winged helix DNA-binding protein [Gorillibacterium sp.]|nr:winged helix DNA-binding protein [Gorillibacterium sp.]